MASGIADVLLDIIWVSLLLITVWGVFALPFYLAVLAGKRTTSSRQAADYWREKFKDETVQHEQQETLLRASKRAETPQVLLHPVWTEEKPTSAMQLVRAAGEQEPQP